MKLTRAQQAYFEEYVKDLFACALQDATNQDGVDKLLSMIDYKDYGKRFGESVLENCSYMDIKAAHRAYSDPAVIRASIAIEKAISSVIPTGSDLENIQFMAGFLTSGIYKDADMLDAIADQTDEVQAAAVQNLFDQRSEDRA